MIHLPIVNYVFYAERSLIWRFSALKPNSKLTLLGEHSFQVNIQVLLPDVQLTKSITAEYFCPVLPPADHYYTKGSLTSQWKLVKIIGYFYLNTGRRAKLFFSFFLSADRWLQKMFVKSWVTVFFSMTVFSAEQTSYFPLSPLPLWAVGMIT